MSKVFCSYCRLFFDSKDAAEYWVSGTLLPTDLDFTFQDEFVWVCTTCAEKDALPANRLKENVETVRTQQKNIFNKAKLL